MNLNRNIFYVSLTIAGISILLSILLNYFVESIDSKWISFLINVTIGLFTSSIVTSFLSISSYFREENNLNKKYYIISSILLQKIMSVIEYVDHNKKPDDLYRKDIDSINEINSELMYLFNTESYLLEKSQQSKFAESVLVRTLNILKLIELMINIRHNNSANMMDELKTIQQVISIEEKAGIQKLIEIHKTELLKEKDNYTLKDYYG
ncbi:hypothetical protein MKX34_03525 [Paenibacillus sp. FSL R5-0636]|uniref:hypothetical protein n=1 Tax=Paenibacillus TaxID=44249 RepID=UPI00096FD996|nr:hypothetical protein [Paenibacillus odorifer]OMD02297.1 hypothetical protein BJP46_16555 [Paenibacillus odorifer]OMD05177.1 hypothetical protein BJP49_20740 [Paenibacillus odorifer]